MNCQQYEELMMKHFDRIASDNEITVLKKHLEKCSQCRYQFEQLESIIGSLEKDFEPEIPAEFEANVMIKIDRYENTKNSSQIKTNSILAVMMGLILFIPPAFIIIDFENISIYEILMGFFPSLSFFSDILLVVLSVIKLMGGYISGNNELSSMMQYVGPAIIFITVFISISMFIHKVDNNL
ncbi:zf-HC2 domain-containing protein [Candidatus Desantisbacteria bacterium]|nr:zf-HC2 domain-containing protein [Candidatus Desantisbacteria bacterium]